MKINRRTSLMALLFIATLLLTTGCDLVPLHMRDQAKMEPNEETNIFVNGTTSQPPPANTIPRGEWGEMKMDDEFYTGSDDEGNFVNIEDLDRIAERADDREFLLRGQDQYDVFCAPCHGRIGDGQGMIVQRGMKQPNSFHIDRLRDIEDGYFYNSITNGFGVMYSYASRIHPEDRWAIIAYIRALQFSQNVDLSTLSSEQAEQIEIQLEGATE